MVDAALTLYLKPKKGRSSHERPFLLRAILN